MKNVTVMKEVEMWECEICGKHLHSKDVMQTHCWMCWELHEKRPWYPVGSYVVTIDDLVCKVTGGEMDDMGFSYELCELDATVLKDGLPSASTTRIHCRVDGIASIIDPTELHDLVAPVKEALEAICRGNKVFPWVELRVVNDLYVDKALDVIVRLGKVNIKEKE